MQGSGFIEMSGLRGNLLWEYLFKYFNVDLKSLGAYEQNWSFLVILGTKWSNMVTFGNFWPFRDIFQNHHVTQSQH